MEERIKKAAAAFAEYVKEDYKKDQNSDLPEIWQQCLEIGFGAGAKWAISIYENAIEGNDTKLTDKTICGS